MKSDGRGNSLKNKKNKAGLTVTGKLASEAVNTALAAGIVVFKRPVNRVRMVKNRLKGFNPSHCSPDKNQLPGVQPLKVSRIKAAVENGLYSVDADSVAENIVERCLERLLGYCRGAYVRRNQ